MANRILLGNRTQDSSGYGLYVSKPGANVLTCDVDDLIFSSLDSTSSPFASKGVVQVLSTNNGAGTTAVPTVDLEINLTSVSSGSLSFQYGITADNAQVWMYRTTGANATMGSNLSKGVYMTSISSSGATANRSGTGAIYKGFAMKLMSGDTLY